MAINLIDIGLAFLEGLVLIASPCILPVLPLILSGSLVGGKSRPYGIIVGFIVSFSAFAMLSASLIKILHVDLDLFKNLSLIFLGCFALMLLFKPLSNAFERITSRIADLGHIQPAGQGFGSGVLMGALIGLVWTPCAGPILAAALIQIIRQGSTLQSFILVLAFSLGASIPMLCITLMGRELITKLQLMVRYAELIRKILGILILLSVLYIAFGMNIQSSQTQTQEPKLLSAQLINPLSITYPAPEFKEIDGWLNSKPLSMAELKGKVVLVDFWTYSCINCIRTLPYITSWDKKYRSLGLVIVGVHAPEFEFEKKQSNIEAALTRFGIEYPVAIDNKLGTWDAFHNLYWPAHYLIDRNGRVVYTHFGEGEYEVTEHNIRLLLNAPERITTTTQAEHWHNFSQTPETYLGYFRFENMANFAEVKKDETVQYFLPQNLKLHQWALNGLWKIEGQKIISEGAHCTLRLSFNAKKVFLVMGSTNNKTIQVKVSLNGKVVENEAGSDVHNGIVQVNEHRLYELIQQQTATQGLLELEINEPDLEAFAFTFGS